MPLRHGSIVDQSGWLLTGRLTTKKKYYKLKGVILSQHKNERSPPIWKIPILGSELITKQEKHKIILPEFKLSLTAMNNEDYRTWLDAIKSASARRVTKYYEVENKIGEGTFGQVMIGRCRQSDETVAVKVVPKKNLRSKDLVRLQTEALVLTTASDDNIVQGLDVFDEEDRLIFVMEHLSGGNLQERLSQMMPLREDQIRSVATGILKAVSSLHKLGIVHRDIKLENVMLADMSEKLKPKLIDFGFGAQVRENDSEGKQLMKTMLGSWNYISPEQIARRPYGQGVDLWAVGVIIYWMVEKKFPFESETNVDIIKNIRSELPAFSDAWNNYSPGLKTLCLSLLEKDDSVRISADEALKSAWICAGEFSKSKNMQLAVVDGSSGLLSDPLILLKQFKLSNVGYAVQGFLTKSLDLEALSETNSMGPDSPLASPTMDTNSNHSVHSWHSRMSAESDKMEFNDKLSREFEAFQDSIEAMNETKSIRTGSVLSLSKILRISDDKPRRVRHESLKPEGALSPLSTQNAAQVRSFDENINPLKDNPVKSNKHVPNKTRRGKVNRAGHTFSNEGTNDWV
eukprot:Plantae.Rhodophyta-Purpureofilum_apyrenoidigerum.ctg19537.p1 GENE.Plantae.Rhodophyta-Purpureofilum_apyrenoidigerum.ctg19537~~Plantae.Rhodophyta-Purpureofilum_apyrenoidigerum.ctg19537.p1  ORF type:complete len:572 (-),score=139.05 Plantae.Rhodophyta-Purpureofilum_apyrenoidigerum.ctg19537:49-1764(-)